MFYPSALDSFVVYGPAAEDIPIEVAFAHARLRRADAGDGCAECHAGQLFGWRQISRCAERDAARVGNGRSGRRLAGYWRRVHAARLRWNTSRYGTRAHSARIGATTWQIENSHIYRYA